MLIYVPSVLIKHSSKQGLDFLLLVELKKKKKNTFQIQINLFYDPSSTAYYPFGSW